MGWDVLGPQSEYGWAQQDVTTLNARGLGSGETPLRRWGGYRGSVIVSVERSHRDAVATPNYRSLVKRLVLHRSVTPTGVANYYLHLVFLSRDSTMAKMYPPNPPVSVDLR